MNNWKENLSKDALERNVQKIKEKNEISDEKLQECIDHLFALFNSVRDDINEQTEVQVNYFREYYEASFTFDQTILKIRIDTTTHPMRKAEASFSVYIDDANFSLGQPKYENAYLIDTSNCFWSADPNRKVEFTKEMADSLFEHMLTPYIEME